MSYRYLTTDERNVIWQMRRLGRSRAEIARCLGRSRSTISRELRRNAGFDCGYFPAIAQALAGDDRGLARCDASAAAGPAADADCGQWPRVRAARKPGAASGPGGVLCSSLQFVGARNERELGWPAAIVSSESDAADPFDKRATRPLRSSLEQPSAKMPQLSEVPGRKAQSGGLDPLRAGLRRRPSGTVPLHLRCEFAV